MNREFKFRAWHKKRKKMYEVLHLHLASANIEGKIWATCKGYSVIEQKDINIQMQPNECIIMQFTGVVDCSGASIYEGDIIRGYDSKNQPVYHCIVYNDSECRFEAIYHLDENKKLNRSGNFSQTWIIEHSKLVVGNIYKNKDLVKKIVYA